jgi:chorismate mutase
LTENERPFSAKGSQAMNIEYWRTEIDEVDRELLRLLNRRARLAIKVGALKRAAGKPCSDPDRERLVLTTLQQANTGPLDSRAVAKLFRRIIGESRRVEMQPPHSARDREISDDRSKLVERSSAQVGLM